MIAVFCILLFFRVAHFLFPLFYVFLSVSLATLETLFLCTPLSFHIPFLLHCNATSEPSMCGSLDELANVIRTTHVPLFSQHTYTHL